jgi:PAS domain S-box-containing protein
MGSLRSSAQTHDLGHLATECLAINRNQSSRAAALMARLYDSTVFRGPDQAIDFISTTLEASTEYSIIGKDLDGNILLWNEGARRLYGWEPEEVVGKANSRILHTPEDAASGLPERMMRGAIADGKWEGVLKRRRKDGTAFTARVVATPRRDGAGNPVGLLLISKDISGEIGLDERKRFERELQLKNGELERANQGKDRFLASMSHELRTPLNAILGFTGTVLMGLPGPLNDEQRTQLQTVQSSARHLLSIINDLLDLAKIEAGKWEGDFQPVSSREVADEVVASLTPLAREKGLELKIVAPNDAPTVVTDRRALSRILINLASNAIKFTDRGEVRLEIHHRGRDGARLVVFDVVDNGVGVKEEDRAALFSAYEQLKSDGTAPRQGTGLGLHISQRLASQIGGTISFRSKFREGSTFTLTLPARSVRESRGRRRAG